MLGYRDLLRNRTLAPFLLSGAFSFAAPSTVLVILVWATAIAYPNSLPLHTTYAALALALLGLFATIPTLAAAIVSGTIADRIDRGRVMRATNLAALAAAAALLVLLWSRPTTAVALPGPSGFYLPLWMILAFPVWGAITVAATLFRPAFNATLPKLVPSAALGRANGATYGVAVSLSVVGSLLATGLIAPFGLAVASVVPLALFVATAGSLLLLPRLPPNTPSVPRRFSVEVTEGYRYLWRHRALLQITVSALAINFLSALAFVELGLYVRDWLGVTQAILLGAMVTGASVGSGIGTILAGRLRFERRSGAFLILLAAFQGFAVIALAFSRSINVSIPLMFLFGLFPGMSGTIFLATIQATVPNDVLGRVLAADEVGSFAMVPVGQYAGGLLTVEAGIQSTYLVVGTGTVAVGVAMAAFRGLRTLGFEPEGHPPARSATPPTDASLPAATQSSGSAALPPKSVGETTGLERVRNSRRPVSPNVPVPRTP